MAPRGTIQPFGGALGYKGFGLGLLVEILVALLAGQDTSLDPPYINGLCRSPSTRKLSAAAIASGRWPTACAVT